MQSGLDIVLGTYPITPASDILHELSKHKAFGVTTFQAEDEIAGIGAAIGASFSGKLGITSTSGPGIALKSEAIGLAVMTELPLLVIDVQRGGPSTGLPTKTEQADLLQAMFGRNGEAPVPIVAPQSPGDCFDAAVEAIRIAVTYRTPVMLLSDGYLANGSEPWRLPEVADLPDDRPGFATERKNLPNGPEGDGAEFWPYLRDEETLARPWAIPGTPGLEHRIGGLEKGDGHGNISYDPANHDLMVRTRQAKIDRIADSLPPLEVDDPSGDAKVLVIGWGSTYGPIGAGVRRVRKAGYQRRADAPAPPQPVPEGPRRDPPALRQGSGAGDEPRPALAAAARQVPRRRHRLQPRARAAAQGGRARRGHRPPRVRGRGHRGRPRRARPDYPPGGLPMSLDHTRLSSRSRA